MWPDEVVVVVGAGGAGRGLAFGAKFKGAQVIIANRDFERAKKLAEACGGTAMTLARVVIDHKHSTDVESPPPRVCMRIHPEGTHCGML